MSWFEYLAPLTIGTVIASTGVLFGIRSVKGYLAGARTRLRGFEVVAQCVFFTFITIVGLFTFGAMITGPTPVEARRVSNAVFLASPDEITTIEIRPYTNESYPQLVPQTVVIRDPEDIARVSKALAEAESFSPNHPRTTWSCFLVISTKNQTHFCEVHGSSNNGVLVQVVSGIDLSSWRTSYGNYRSNPLGSVLKSLVENLDATGERLP